MRGFLVFLLLVGWSRVGLAVDGPIRSLLGEAVAALFRPAASVSALLCAEADDVVELSKVLSKNGMSINSLDLESFEASLNRFPWHRTIVLLDFGCPRALEILKKANDSGWFTAPLKWAILQGARDSCTGEDCLLRDFGGYAMYPDSEVVVFRRLAPDRVEMSSVYRPSPARDMVVEERGSWSSAAGIRVRHVQPASRRRRDLRGTPLKSTIVVTNPDTLNHLTDYHDKHVDTVTKCNYVWLHHLVHAMNATVSWSVVNSWGYRDKNGSWNGMMGQLSRREIDIGGTGMFLVGERWNHVDYLPLSVSSRQAFIFREPALSLVSNLFTLPFNRSVWIAAGLLLLVIFGLLVVSMRWEWRARDPPAPSLSDNMLLVVGAVAQQGYGINPRSVPARIVLLMLLMAVLNLYASYSANIVALLQSTTNSIRTLKDLLASPIKCGAQDAIYNRHYFKMERDPIKRAIIEQKIESKIGKSHWMSAVDGIKKMRHGFFAFFMEVGSAYRIIQETFEEDEKCGFREMHFIVSSNPAFTTVKQSPYLEILRVNSLKIGETGLKSKDMLRFYTKRPPCNGRSKFVSVGLRECYFAFYIMSSGVLVTLWIFFVEAVLMKCIMPQRKNSNDKSTSMILSKFLR